MPHVSRHKAVAAFVVKVGRRYQSTPVCSCGGIGRRAGFRFQWETVQVQVLSAAWKHPDYKARMFSCKGGKPEAVMQACLYIMALVTQCPGCGSQHRRTDAEAGGKTDGAVIFSEQHTAGSGAGDGCFFGVLRKRTQGAEHEGGAHGEDCRRLRLFSVCDADGRLVLCSSAAYLLPRLSAIYPVDRAWVIGLDRRKDADRGHPEQDAGGGGLRDELRFADAGSRDLY